MEASLKAFFLKNKVDKKLKRFIVTEHFDFCVLPYFLYFYL